MGKRYTWECNGGKQYVVDSHSGARVLRVFEDPVLCRATEEYFPGRFTTALLMTMNSREFSAGMDTDAYELEDGEYKKRSKML